MRWTFEEKLKMVKDYLKDGTIPYVEHCSRQSLAHSIRLWARAYNLHGDAALKHKQNHVFKKKDKVNAVKRILAGQSNASVSISLGIHPSTIAKWLEIYEKDGCFHPLLLSHVYVELCGFPVFHDQYNQHLYKRFPYHHNALF